MSIERNVVFFSSKYSSTEPVRLFVAMLFNDDIGDIRLGGILVVFVFAMDEHNHVCVLFDEPGSRRSESFGRPPSPRLSTARDNWNEQEQALRVRELAVLGSGYFRDLLNHVVTIAIVCRYHQLQVVDDDETKAFFAL